jgi:DNA modification methylase
MLLTETGLADGRSALGTHQMENKLREHTRPKQALPGPTDRSTAAAGGAVVLLGNENGATRAGASTSAADEDAIVALPNAALTVAASDYAGLSEVDWSFSARERHSELEALHPYPAKFIAELPRTLIHRLRPPAGTVVFDPFCGSGTTLAESQRAGLVSAGVDLNPIACLIARVRTSPLPAYVEEKATEIARRATRTNAPTPAIPNLDHWFERQVQRPLAQLASLISDVADHGLRDVLSLALSSIVVRVSNQDSDTRYAAVRKDVSTEGVLSAFLKAATRIAAALRTRDYDLTPTEVVEANTLEMDSDRLRGRVGLVVTSPPYPNAYEYWLYHKYRMFWLGKNPLAVKAAEIGARAHFFRKDHHTAEHFGKQMGATLDLIGNMLIEEGHACFVVGRSRIHGRIVDNAAIIEEEAQRRGFERVFVTERTIASARKSFNLSHANIKTETVLVLRRIK